MALPEFVAPVLSIAGPAALVFVVLRLFPRVANAVLVLLAGIVAIVTRDKERRDSCHKVLDKVTRASGDQDKPDGPPSLNPGPGP